MLHKMRSTRIKQMNAHKQLKEIGDRALLFPLMALNTRIPNQPNYCMNVEVCNLDRTQNSTVCYFIHLQ